MNRRNEVLLIKVPGSLVIYLKGLLMGMANIIPGVSGGTMALITGIYERFIHALRTIDFKFVTLFFKRDTKGAKENLMSIDYALLVPLLLGIVTATLLLARGIVYLLDHQTGPVYGFFFGLILGSAGFLYKYIDRIDGRHLLSGALGFLIVFIVVGMDEIVTNHSLPAIFLAGAISICAMVLPGISGSLLLLILGQYDHLLEALNKGDLKVLVVFMAGAVVGIVLFSRLLDHLLKHHRSMTMVFLFGCMLGALRLPAQMIGDNTDLTSIPSVTLVVVSAVLGFATLIALERRSMEIQEGLGIEVDRS